MNVIELYSARVCPFAHRARLAVAEKGLPCELVEIDLKEKPSWYQEISPKGAVPALRHGDFLLRESLIINEYIDELRPEPALLPSHPQQRAEARLWIDFAGQQLVPNFYRLLRAQAEKEKSEAKERLSDALKTIDMELKRRALSGPYWFGDRVSLTDIAFYPWFERWAVLEHYRDFALPPDFSALRDWIAAMQRRDSVRTGSAPASFYIQEYEVYASGKK